MLVVGVMVAFVAAVGVFVVILEKLFGDSIRQAFEDAADRSLPKR